MPKKEPIDGMSATWSLRRGTLHDATAMKACLTTAYAEAAAKLSDLPPMADGITDDITNKEAWVADQDGTVVGVLVLEPRAEVLVIANVAVAASQQGQGLGRGLFEFATQEAKRRGLGQLRLSTHAGMVETVALYRRTGWVEIGRAGNTITMAKPVNR